MILKHGKKEEELGYIFPQQTEISRRTSDIWKFLNILAIITILVLLGVGSIRYENKISELQGKIDMLESTLFKFPLDQTLNLNSKDAERSKREANPDPQTYSWRSSSQVQSTRTVSRGGNPAPEQLVRNDQDETFFTNKRTGSYVRPSGLKEMWERLPPESNEMILPAPRPAPQPPIQIQTRTLVQPPIRTQLPPVQRVGSGQSGVSARIVKYNDNDQDERQSSRRNLNIPKSAVAAHFVADVSNFTASNNNGRLRNANGVFQIWQPAKWVKSADFQLDVNQGLVTSRNGGLYQIYAQIYYDDHDYDNSFIVEVNGNPLLQCKTMRGANSCFTAGLVQLQGGDKILIKNDGTDRFSIYKPEKTFFGLVKLD